MINIVPHHGSKRGALTPIVHQRGRSVRVYVIDSIRANARVLQGCLHRLNQSIPRRMRICYSVTAERSAVARNLRIYFSASMLSSFQIFEHEEPRAFTENETV